MWLCMEINKWKVKVSKSLEIGKHFYVLFCFSLTTFAHAVVNFLLFGEGFLLLFLGFVYSFCARRQFSVSFMN